MSQAWTGKCIRPYPAEDGAVLQRSACACVRILEAGEYALWCRLSSRQANLSVYSAMSVCLHELRGVYPILIREAVGHFVNYVGIFTNVKVTNAFRTPALQR